jgi:hypothetical protein
MKPELKEEEQRKIEEKKKLDSIRKKYYDLKNSNNRLEQ